MQKQSPALSSRAPRGGTGLCFEHAGEDGGGNYFVACGDHGVAGALACDAANGSGVAEHFGEDAGFGAAVVDAGDAGAATVEIAEDVALVLVGDGAFDLHDGLQQHGCGETRGFAEGFASGQAEGLVVGVLGVEGTIDDSDAGIDEGLHGG